MAFISLDVDENGRSRNHRCLGTCLLLPMLVVFLLLPLGRASATEFDIKLRAVFAPSGVSIADIGDVIHTEPAGTPGPAVNWTVKSLSWRVYDGISQGRCIAHDLEIAAQTAAPTIELANGNYCVSVNLSIAIDTGSRLEGRSEVEFKTNQVITVNAENDLYAVVIDPGRLTVRWNAIPGADLLAMNWDTISSKYEVVSVAQNVFGKPDYQFEFDSKLPASFFLPLGSYRVTASHDFAAHLGTVSATSEVTLTAENPMGTASLSYDLAAVEFSAVTAASEGEPVRTGAQLDVFKLDPAEGEPRKHIASMDDFHESTLLLGKGKYVLVTNYDGHVQESDLHVGMQTAGALALGKFHERVISLDLAKLQVATDLSGLGECARDAVVHYEVYDARAGEPDGLPQRVSERVYAGSGVSEAPQFLPVGEYFVRGQTGVGNVSQDVPITSLTAGQNLDVELKPSGGCVTLRLLTASGRLVASPLWTVTEEATGKVAARGSHSEPMLVLKQGRYSVAAELDGREHTFPILIVNGTHQIGQTTAWRCVPPTAPSLAELLAGAMIKVHCPAATY